MTDTPDDFFLFSGVTTIGVCRDCGTFAPCVACWEEPEPDEKAEQAAEEAGWSIRDLLCHECGSNYVDDHPDCGPDGCDPTETQERE